MDLPSSIEPFAPDADAVRSVLDFNRWCAAHGRPTRLVSHLWEDGAREWGIEWRDAHGHYLIAYGTGQSTESEAVACAFAFLAGVEWGQRMPRERWDLDEPYGGYERRARERRLGWPEDEIENFLHWPEIEPLFEPLSEPQPPAGLDLNPALPPQVHRLAETVPVTIDRRKPILPPVEVLAEQFIDEPLDEPDLDADLDAEPDPVDGPAPLNPPPIAAPAPAPVVADQPDPPAPRSARPPETHDLPATRLLQPPKVNDTVPDEEHLARNAGRLETVLRNFGIRGEIMEVRPGPVVTLYELEPAPGTKSSRVIGLSDDIARSMSAVSARIAIVPGRSVIGLELPNAQRQMVYLREIFEHDAFTGSNARLALALGKDIGGEPVIADLARMPHLLIAGTTGSGKSVGINTMILSLLWRLPPSRCRFIMVDPKMLELSVYDGIPHLLTPVVTEPRKAVVALKWAVREMESRYHAMSKLGVRNIEGYNTRVEAGTEGPEHRALPYIVIVVDEMADLMLVAGKEIEAAIQRLAQMARAAGIHLIMATQRPSVDVITGTIKANFPTRISFQVTSKIDSRTVLGEAGAEQLLGQGDMLFMAGGGRITRVHGPFVADEEVEQIVAHQKAQGEPAYLDEITLDEDELGAMADDSEGFEGSGDDLYDQAVALVIREKKCSVSFIQRHLQIGYNRSARMVERMENEGIISQANHVGKREVLGRR